ncbi:GUN4 domain-containing protein [Nostoc sp. UHCC 0926]|uniref:GUN4 domain-containing protein n=1 Tax=unclassified Nostoc TaxID=2593658 RepID=UPI002362899A|nr:GUN4 domain-containing protein [Nostoc sp. UHCC 0926]WDD32198.1 GUN4 domain-containing protein [Nostoc sp. UHCC 0926]
MTEFDVFLCHNSEDKEEVIEIAYKLQREHNIKPWLDDWELQPGYPWQPELERQIQNINSAAVFIGKTGIGPWQEDEIYSFLREFKRRKCPIIPVLLPNAPQKPELPLFLTGITWVDFRTQSRVYTDPWIKLKWGITGIKPETQTIIHPPLFEQPIKPPTTTPEPKTDDLASEKNIDYTRLCDLLAAKNWKEADQETYRVMIQAVGKKDGDWFTPDELLNFPCTDLRTIDRLWVEYSNGHFGFSVQKEIYLSVGGKADGKYYKEAWEKFGDRVGWRVEKSWLITLTQNDTSSPRGHLPRVGRLGFWEAVLWGQAFNWQGVQAAVTSSLASRLANCNI